MDINFNNDGLVPVITQDYKTKEVLMLAYMNKEAYDKTLETGKVHYYSRSRKKLWLKGETSGHFQIVKGIYFDCDEDSILILAEQIGAACHTGNFSCFYRDSEGNEIPPSTGPELQANANGHILDELYEIITDRRNNPKEGSYTNYLFSKGLDKILKKLGEEASEVIIAAKNQSSSEMTYEISDLLYHLSVLIVQSGLNWDDIWNELRTRR